MARGWVYVMTNDAMPNLVKVGFTLKDTHLRAQELSHTGLPKKWTVRYQAYVFQPRDVEQKVHKLLRQYSYSKEFFRCPVDVAVVAIKEVSEGTRQFESDENASITFRGENLESYKGIWIDTLVGQGKYEGEILNGKRHGKGKFVVLETGYSYDGEYKADKKNGLGISIFEGKKYIGEWKNNYFHGKGILVKTGEIFEGIWEHGALIRGHVNTKNGYGDEYSGEWQNGMRNGKGKMIYADGGIYEGGWKNGERDGVGKFISQSGDVYEGDWKDGREDGRGKFTSRNGDVYEGNWKDGREDGAGILKRKDGSVYEGNWKAGDEFGFGTALLADGTKYEGMWEYGCLHGEGTLISSNKNSMTGVWSYVFFGTSQIFERGYIKHEIRILEENSVIKKTTVKESFRGNIDYVFEDGSKYVGEWFDENPLGNGRYMDSESNEYSGLWESWGCGSGIIKFKNGDIFVGSWIDFLQDGLGEMRYVNGQNFAGKWKEGKALKI